MKVGRRGDSGAPSCVVVSAAVFIAEKHTFGELQTEWPSLKIEIISLFQRSQQKRNQKSAKCKSSKRYFSEGEW